MQPVRETTKKPVESRTDPRFGDVPLQMDASPLFLRRGPRDNGLAVGITTTDNMLVIASVRDEPLRLTGIYRQDLGPTSGSPEALDKRLRNALRLGRKKLGLRRGISTTVALHPGDRSLHLPLDQTTGSTVAVRCRPRLPQLLQQACFHPDTFDLFPAALARVALCAIPDRVALRHRSGWSVQMAPDVLDAAWCEPGVSVDFSLGKTLTDTFEVTTFAGIQVPSALLPMLHIGLDAGALGAALRTFGCSPQVGRQPTLATIDLRSVDTSVRAAIA